MSSHVILLIQALPGAPRIFSCENSRAAAHRLQALPSGSRSPMKCPSSQFDAPFWVALLAGVIVVGSLGCLGLAAAAQDAARSDTGIVSVGDT